MTQQQEIREANMRALRFANRWDEVLTENERLKRMLQQAGFTDHGGEYWKPPLGKPSFQQRVVDWSIRCFGARDTYHPVLRAARFIEEALKLVQAGGVTRAVAMRILHYVYDRPVGTVSQEIGGTLVSLSVLCESRAYDMKLCGEAELSRIEGKIEEIHARHVAKPDFGIQS